MIHIHDPLIARSEPLSRWRYDPKAPTAAVRGSDPDPDPERDRRIGSSFGSYIDI